MFSDSRREDLEKDYAYSRDRLFGAMARTLELLLEAHLRNLPAVTGQDAIQAHKAASLLGGLGACLENFARDEQKLREYRRG